MFKRHAYCYVPSRIDRYKSTSIHLSLRRLQLTFPEHHLGITVGGPSFAEYNVGWVRVRVLLEFDVVGYDEVSQHRLELIGGEEPTRTNSGGADIWVERRMRRPIQSSTYLRPYPKAI